MSVSTCLVFMTIIITRVSVTWSRRHHLRVWPVLSVGNYWISLMITDTRLWSVPMSRLLACLPVLDVRGKLPGKMFSITLNLVSYITWSCWQKNSPKFTKYSRQRRYFVTSMKKRMPALVYQAVHFRENTISISRASECQGATSTVKLDSSGLFRLLHQSNNIEEIFPLFRELYQKVINLEQNQCQYEIRISQLNSQVEMLKFENEETFSKSLNGEFVWRIKDFNSIYQKLRHNHNFVIYSKGFYTSYYGYKVCLRSNLYIAKGELSLLSCSRVVFLFCSDNWVAGEEYLGLFVHFMRGDNDDLLTWPWTGDISMCLINQEHGHLRWENEKCEL